MGVQWNKYISNEFSFNLDAVKNPLHLMNIICELSSSTAMCSLVKKSNRFTHYYVFRPVIPSAEFFSMLYVPGGIDIYLRHRFPDATDYINCGSLDEIEWSVEYRDIIKDIATIFPLPRNFQLKPYVGGEKSFLYVGDCRYGIRCNDTLLKMTTLQWNVYQVQTGNCFIMNMGHRRFYISRRLHKTIGSVRAIIREKDLFITKLTQELENYKNVGINKLP